MIGTSGGFTIENAFLHFEIVEVARGVFDLAGGRILAKRQPGARRVHHADGLVGQLASGDVAVRKFHRRAEAFVQNADAVVLLK